MKQHNCIISSNVEEKKDYYLVQVLADLEGQGWAMPPRLADLGQWEPLIIYSVSEKMCQLWQVVVSTRMDQV